MPEEDMASRIAEVQRLAVAVEGEATSENGAVRVVVGSAGQIKDLDLRMNAFQMSGVELGAMIVETIRAATDEAAERLSGSVGAVLGEEFTRLGDLEGDR